MSELKATTVYDAYWTANSVGEGTGIQVYLKSEADKVITDLEESHKMEVEQLLMEIMELKKKINEARTELELWRDGNIIREETLNEIESLKASHYAEMVDAGMRERRLKRALYKACANWAKCEERISNMDAYDASEYLPSAEKQFRKKAERWSEMESKCRAKAEGYK